MAEFTLFPNTDISLANSFSSPNSITIQDIENPYEFTLNVASGDVVVPNTEISISSTISISECEKINGTVQNPKVTITYA